MVLLFRGVPPVLGWYFVGILEEVYHQRFGVNRLLVFIGTGVLIGALKLRNTYT